MVKEKLLLDEFFMQRAITLAKKGKGNVYPNPLVGCVIVKNGKIIGEGWHKQYGKDHAEIVALSDAKSKQNSVKGSLAYITLEPCSHYGKTPPCVDALIKAKIAHVIVSMLDPNPKVLSQGIKKLKQANIKIQVGILENESRQLNLGYLKTWENLDRL